ncbi:MAG: hypothetical protein E7626_01250 [Ruminococcaceae bacterium]|nr:hypothetical protein [Oscillospiraceae bacterium]
MNISDGIIKVLDNLAMKFGIAIDWTAENALPYLQELAGRLIQYEIWTSVGWMVIMLFVCGLMWLIASVIHRRLQGDKDWSDLWSGEDVAITIVYIVAIVLSIATILVIGTQIFDIIEAKTIPEKTIYDYISQAIQKGNNA